eukprot:m.67171 g.67171  ORF g.67171 m.67171 type:complete len:240 (-) comp11867_c0_seq5:624-1343(-)
MPRKWALLICFVFVVISIFWFVNDKYIVKRERKSDTIEKLKDSARTTFGNKLVDSGLLDFSSNQLGELPDNILAQLLGSVVNSSTHMYGAKDNHGTSLDCLRIISTTVTGVVRYLGVYHHMRKDIKKYQIHLAQSFDLMQWEFLRVLVTNADMPSFGVDVRTGWILLVYEDFISGSGLVPCSIGIRLYKGQCLLWRLETFISPLKECTSLLQETPQSSMWHQTHFLKLKALQMCTLMTL